jgi:hypothetical protein
VSIGSADKVQFYVSRRMFWFIIRKRNSTKFWLLIQIKFPEFEHFIINER